MKQLNLISRALALVVSIPAFITATYAATGELPFPSFPASFEDSTFQGKSGCSSDDARMVFAISKNEGLEHIGAHSRIETRIDGVFITSIFFSMNKNYGWMMKSYGNGELCINQKIINLKLNRDILRNLSQQEPITPEDCTFAPQVINLCGTLQQLIERLGKGGYSPDWQAVNEEGHTMTMMSGTGQSWILTTHTDTGATIFTGMGKGEFVFSNNNRD